MALVEIDLTPYMEDRDWDAIDNVAKNRLKHINLPWSELAFCLDYSIKVSYYEEDIADVMEEMEWL